MRSAAEATSFNPRPPLLAGDAHPSDAVRRALRVSIRARHCWRAMLARVGPCPVGSRFQSAPAIAGGRCLLGEFFDPLRHRFNPRPPLLAGDAAGAIGLGTNHAVSIRARHCWRAMRDGGHGVRSGFCFNPRPPLLAGDAGPAVAAGVLKRVSIRARHCWRAMRRLPR